MRKKFSRGKLKIRFVFVLMIFALASISATYAGFFDEITITGTVETSMVEFQDVTYIGTENDGQKVTPRPPDEETPRTPTGVPFSDTLDVVVDCEKLLLNNQYTATVTFTVESIPVYLHHLSLEILEGTEWLGGNVDLIMTVTENENPVLVSQGSQLHPDELITLLLVIEIPESIITEDDDIDENQVEPLVVAFDGKLMISLEIVQWTGSCEDETPSGPDCKEQTAWGGNNGINIDEPGSWWYYYDTNGDETQTIWADQTINVGSVHISEPVNGQVTITIELTDGWQLQDDNEAVKIQGYAEGGLPNFRPAPGLFTTYKENELTVTVASYPYYAIHLDVQRCPD